MIAKENVLDGEREGVVVERRSQRRRGTTRSWIKEGGGDGCECEVLFSLRHRLLTLGSTC
jgi:hypothetical protein